jgi:mono/diheme cytochrome c family protein
MIRSSRIALQRAVVAGACLAFTTSGGWSISHATGSADGWQIPNGAERESNPVVLDRAVLAKGQGLYKSKCQRCHGVSGRGDGPDAERKDPPGDLTDARRASRNPDGVMFYKIWNGRSKPNMPAMKTDITRVEVWTVIHYVRTLRRADGPSRD